ncbi:MAG: hypothetical protein ACKOC5_11055 [Chloroflexota bacterium]
MTGGHFGLVFSLPLMLAVALMLLLVALSGWLDARLNWRSPAV